MKKSVIIHVTFECLENKNGSFKEATEMGFVFADVLLDEVAVDDEDVDTDEVTELNNGADFGGGADEVLVEDVVEPSRDGNNVVRPT